MALENNWIDVPKGLAGGSSVVAFALVMAGAALVHDGSWYGWLMLAAAPAVAALSWFWWRDYLYGGRSDEPDPGTSTYVEPPSNVKRLD